MLVVVARSGGMWMAPDTEGGCTTMGGVRKQYNFWPGDTGLDAWDVDGLIASSAGLPVGVVALDDIRDLDTDYWFRYGPEVPTVRRIAEHLRLIDQADTRYPIILAADGRVMDGMHRVVKALLQGETTIRAVRFEIDPEPDYRNCSPGDLPY